MFTEILRIIPRLDRATANQMEATLSARFSRVARRFGGGLKAVIKGTIFGIGIGLLSKLLNPLEELHDKIKDLLDQGKSTQELADEFGTTPGKLRRLQNVAGNVGVSPDELKDLMQKYATAVETARKELEDPAFDESKITTGTKAIRNFVDESDMAEGFFKFIQSLKAAGEAGTGQGQIRNPDGTLRARSGYETQSAIEREIFGEAQRGANRRLINSDLTSALNNTPSEAKLNGAYDRVNGIGAEERRLRIQRETDDFLNQANRVNLQMIKSMAEAEKIRMEKEAKQLENFEAFQKAAIGIDTLIAGLEQLRILLLKGVGYLVDMTGYLKRLLDKFGIPFMGGDKKK